MAARTELVARLDRAIDAVRPFKQRRRGSSGGELPLSLAEMMAVCGDDVVHLDELREDETGAELRAVGEVLVPTTAGAADARLERPAVSIWLRCVATTHRRPRSRPHCVA